ncbi:TauD/TfdA family dioxygenase, partial [Aduncisulcus paluster]
VAPLSKIRVEPLTCSIGAELFDVDLAEVSRSDELFGELRNLLLEHKVLFVRDQNMTRAEHVALAQRFGPLEDHPVADSDPDHPGLVRIYKEIDSAPEHYENSFHCDATWRENPPMGCVLRCVETPPVGGDTIWLPAAMRDQIRGLRARHSIEASFGAAMSTHRRHELHERYPDAEHPVYLVRQASVPEFQVRWRWTPNSVAIWDNRSTQHYAVQDYWPAVRKMERAGICGDRPF